MTMTYISEHELQRTIGKENTLALLKAYGGESVYVSHNLSGSQKIEAIIGKLAMFKLRKTCRGCNIQLPKGPRATKKELIITLLEAGKSYREVARLADAHIRHVWGVARDSGHAPGMPQKGDICRPEYPRRLRAHDILAQQAATAQQA